MNVNIYSRAWHDPTADGRFLPWSIDLRCWPPPQAVLTTKVLFKRAEAAPWSRPISIRRLVDQGQLFNGFSRNRQNAVEQTIEEGSPSSISNEQPVRFKFLPPCLNIFMWKNCFLMKQVSDPRKVIFFAFFVRVFVPSMLHRRENTTKTFSTAIESSCRLRWSGDYDRTWNWV